MKKRSLYFWGATFVFAVAFVFASCSQEDDFIVDNGLDIDSQVPLTRSGAGDVNGPAGIPEVDNQCGTWGLTKVAYNKKIERPTGKINKDGSPQMKRVGSGEYSCSKYYQEINMIHENTYWPRCDKYGNEITTGPDAGKSDKGTSTWMAPSALRSIGKETNALEGIQEYYDSYEELKNRIAGSFSNNHKSGTYIILDRRKNHYYVGKGIEKYAKDHKGEINVQSALGGDYINSNNDSNNTEQTEDRGYVLIY